MAATASDDGQTGDSPAELTTGTGWHVQRGRHQVSCNVVTHVGAASSVEMGGTYRPSVVADGDGAVNTAGQPESEKAVVKGREGVSDQDLAGIGGDGHLDLGMCQFS